MAEMYPSKSKRGIRRIALLRSSSTHLAALFSSMILIAIILGMWQLYQFQTGRVMSSIWLCVAFGLLLTTAIGLSVISYFATKRINEIVSIADQIMRTGDISSRIPIYSRWDDLSTLSHILNHMLDEINRLVHGVRTVSDNIAHDLRHPLTRIRNQMEMLKLQSENLSHKEISHHMMDLVSECDQLLNTFNALLRISNIESGKRHSDFKTLPLHQVLKDVIELYEPVALEKSCNLVFIETPITTIGDKDLLFQAFANLVDNAIKYTPNGGSISVELTTRKSRPYIQIMDSGMGVSDAHKKNVFKRFYRIESYRNTEGNGLGLSLVQAIIHLHQGTISLHDNPTGGLIVTVEL